MADDAALARKTRSEAQLAAADVRINPHLPVIERAAAADMRTPREVAERLLALTLVAAKGEGEDAIAAQVIAERDAYRLFTPHERAFIDDPAPSEHDRTQFRWRYEAAWVLFWALGFLQDEPLGLPDRPCDEVEYLATIVGNDPQLDGNGLKPVDELLDATDLVYRAHWAVRQASLDGTTAIGPLDPDVTMERHHALNWLTGYNDRAEWDDVSTDT